MAGTKNLLPDEKEKLLIDKRHILMAKIKMSPLFWAQLEKHETIMQADIMDIKGKSNPQDQVYELVDHLIRGNQTRYQGFLQALKDTQQSHVVTDILGEEAVQQQQPVRHGKSTMHAAFNPPWRDKVRLLKQKTADLKEQIQLNPDFWDSLMSNHVLSHLDVEDFKNNGRSSKSEQIESLIEHLKRGNKRTYRGFLYALSETDQLQVTKDILGEDVPDLYMLTDHLQDTTATSLLSDGISKNISTNADMLITNKRLHQAILDLKKYYNDNLFKSPLHAFSTMSEEIDLQNVYTTLDIIETQQGKTKKSSIPVDENQILIDGEGKPALTLCVGDAGSGKSTLATRLAWLWATQQANSHEFLGRVKAVIFIEHTVRGKCLKDIIKNSVPGSEENKALVWDLLNDEPENVLVIVEAFEQFRDELVSDTMTSLVNSGVTNMFVTARKDHSCLVPEFRSIFNKHIEVKGFSQDNRVEFAKKLLHEMNCTSNVELFLSTIGQKPRFETNPLNIMLACQLYAEGTIPNKAFDVLTEVELYTKTEERLVEREILKERKMDEDTLVKLRIEALDKVHKLSGYMMLQQRSMCEKADLEFFKIESNSPANVLLLEKKESSATCGDRHYWIWPHSRLQEFDAAMGLAKLKDLHESEWLQLIASQHELNPVTKLLSAILGIEQRYEEVNTLTTATILLQGNSSCQDHQQGDCMSCHVPQQIAQIKYRLAEVDTSEGFGLKKGLRLPDLISVCRCCGSLFNENIKLFKHVEYCWRVGLSENLRQTLYEEMQSHLFPAIDRSENGTVHLVLSTPSDWNEVLVKSEYATAAVVEIHLTKMSEFDTEQFNQQDELQCCVTRILFDVKPMLMHIHQLGIPHSVPVSLVQAANEKKYFIHPQKDAWTVWYSDHDMDISQHRLSDTERYAYIMKLEEHELAIYIHQITDMMSIHQEYLKSSRLEIHVGYPLTTSYYGPQPEEAPSEWQNVMQHIMKKLQPDVFDIVSSATAGMGCAITDEFMSSRMNTEQYDMTYSDTGSVEFQRMNNLRKNIMKYEIDIYEKSNGCLVIKPQHLSDVGKLTGKDIFANQESVQLMVPKCDAPMLQSEFRNCLKHLVSTYPVGNYLIIQSHANDDGSVLSSVMNDNPSLFIGDEKFKVKLENDGRVVGITRVEMSDHVFEDNKGHIFLEVQHLQDMLFLNRKKKHAKKPSMTIHSKSLRGDDSPSPFDEIRETVSYILKSWQPQELVLTGNTSDIIKSFKSDAAVQQLANESGYDLVFGDENKLHFFPIFVAREVMCIRHPKDAVYLKCKEEHFQLPVLMVNFKDARDASSADLQQAALHILTTWQPTQLLVGGCVSLLPESFGVITVSSRYFLYFTSNYGRIFQFLCMRKIQAGTFQDIYQTPDGCLIIRPQCLEDVLKLTKKDIAENADTVHGIRFLIPSCNVDAMRTELRKCIKHIVTTFDTVQHFRMIQSNTGSDLSRVLLVHPAMCIGNKLFEVAHEDHGTALHISPVMVNLYHFAPLLIPEYELRNGPKPKILAVRLFEDIVFIDCKDGDFRLRSLVILVEYHRNDIHLDEDEINKAAGYILDTWQPDHLVVEGLTSQMCDVLKSNEFTKDLKHLYGYYPCSESQDTQHTFEVQRKQPVWQHWAVNVVAMSALRMLLSMILSNYYHLHVNALVALVMFTLWAMLWPWRRKEWTWWWWVLALLMETITGHILYWQCRKQWLPVAIGVIVLTMWPQTWGRRRMWLVGAAVGITAGTCDNCAWQMMQLFFEILIIASVFLCTEKKTDSQHLKFMGLTMASGLLIICRYFLLFGAEHNSLTTPVILAASTCSESKARARWLILGVVLKGFELGYCYENGGNWVSAAAYVISLPILITVDVDPDLRQLVMLLVWIVERLGPMQTLLAMSCLMLYGLFKNQPWRRARRQGPLYIPEGENMLVCLLIGLSSCSDCWMRWLILPAAFVMEWLDLHLHKK